MEFLEINGLKKRYGGFLAIDDVSIGIPKGSVCTLLGPSGCGKTTTLRCIAGLEQADAGRIVLDGVVLDAPGEGVHVAAEKRGLGMVFQSYALWPHKTVYDNLALGLQIAGKSRGETADKVRQVLEVVGMPGVEKRYPGQLSGGQQQRVAVARALALEPKCLLFDEPLSNLDVMLRDRMRFEIRELLTKQAITAVYVTHDQSEAMVISDHICVMNQGRVAEQGSPDALYEHPTSRFAAEFFGRTNLLPVDVPASQPEQGRVVAGSGLLLPSAAAHRLPGMQGAVSAAIRPEAIRITPPGEAPLAGRVVLCVHLGASTEIELDAGGERLRALVAGRRQLRAGEQVGIEIDAADVMLINRD